MKSLQILTLTLVATFTVFTAQANVVTPDTAKNNIILEEGATAKGVTVQTDVFGQAITQQKSEEKPMWIRKAKSFDADFTGYSIELVTVYNEPLDYSATIYQKFGGIIMDQRSEGEYVYLLGTFEKATQADDYLEKVIKPQFPNAQIVKYASGKVAK